MCVLVFFFKQKTAYEMRISDWSSDVCSSDLQYAFDQKAERRLAGKIGAIARDINAGQHDFPIASINQRLDLVDHSARGNGAAVAAPIRNDTECAAMVAAILHTHKGAGVIGKDADQMRGGFADRHHRSEECRVGNVCVHTCSSRGAAYAVKKKVNRHR